MALKNLAVLETYLKDILFSEEEITSKEENREHIFSIKDAEKTLGFILIEDIKAYIFEHEEEAKIYWVKNIDSNDWKNIFEHPSFQRRKPQLVSPENIKDLDDLEFFLLKNGQKNGPLKMAELVSKVETREILLSDMVSHNGGLSWVKLFQVEGFDRRSLNGSDQLPGTPSNDFLSRPVTQANIIGPTTDAITSLAFLGNIKNGKILERENDAIYKQELDKRKKSSASFKNFFFLSIIGIFYLMFNIKSNLKSPFNKVPPQVGEQYETLTPIKMTTPFNTSNSPTNNRINDQQRGRKLEVRNMKPIRPVSRKTFFESNPNSHSPPQPLAEETNYFYDNQTPLELDPVKAKVSKENFDSASNPELAENQENANNNEDQPPAPEADQPKTEENSN